MNTNQTETTELLDEILGSHTSWAQASGWDWYGRMLTQFVLLANGAELEYLTGTYTDDGADGADGCVYAFTLHRVIVGRVSGADPRNADVHVWTFPRSELTQIELETDASVFPSKVTAYGSDADLPWPGTVSVLARYVGGLELRLPAAPPRTNEERAPFNGFLPNLIADLDHPNGRVGLR